MINSLLILAEGLALLLVFSPIKSTKHPDSGSSIPMRSQLVYPNWYIPVVSYQYSSYMFMYNNIYIYISPYLTAWFLSTSHYITMKSIFIGVYTHLQIRHGVFLTVNCIHPDQLDILHPHDGHHQHHGEQTPYIPKTYPHWANWGVQLRLLKWASPNMVFWTPPKLGYKPYNCGYTLW